MNPDATATTTPSAALFATMSVAELMTTRASVLARLAAPDDDEHRGRLEAMLAELDAAVRAGLSRTFAYVA